MKKILALLLVLGLLFSMLPMISAAKNTDSVDIWETINEIENEKIHPKRGRAVAAAEYATIVDDVIAAVEASDSYKEGTISRNGDFFFWETLDGEPNGYSPRLRARLRNSAIVDADPQDYSGIETTSYATRNSTTGVNVAVFQPYYGIDDSFTTQYQTEGESIAKVTGGTCKTYKTTSATIDAIADALESCAVVFFDSHGDTNYARGEDYTSRADTSYILLQTNAGWTAADKAKATGTYGTYYHAFYSGNNPDNPSMKYYCVDGTAIANHMEKSAPNNMLWMAICLGMATDGLNAPLRNKGVGVVYGYSQSVTFCGDYAWESSFWDDMTNSKTVAAAISNMKNKYGEWDCSQKMYNQGIFNDRSWIESTITDARKDRAAFPIVASAEDAYPGHGNVDNLQTVKSTWTLKESSAPSYAFTAQSNNTAYGTVSVSDNVITPTPKIGCEIVDYTVSPSGAATVSKNGINYVVTNLTANCIITINFRQKTTYTVSYSVPIGVSCPKATCYAGESVTLSAPSGAPAEMPNAVFCGWAASAVEKTKAAPEGLLEADTKYMPDGNITFYGVYRFVEDGEVFYASAPKTQGCPCDDYTDLDNAQWYHRGVDYVLENGMMNGIGNGRFAPEGNVTRAMLVTILYRSEGSRDVSGERNPFEDVPNGQWYTDAVIWAAKEGVVTGTGMTTFSPNASITREQIATILYRYAGSPEAGGSLSRFSDASTVSNYAKDAVIWAVNEGIINGMDGKLCPRGNATRAQIAMILYRYLEP